MNSTKCVTYLFKSERQKQTKTISRMFKNNVILHVGIDRTVSVVIRNLKVVDFKLYRICEPVKIQIQKYAS